MPEVREHEPIAALDGMEDGLYFYRKIVDKAKDYISKGGYLLFEIGYNQGEAVSNMMKEAGFSQVSIIKDYAGLDRVVFGVNI
jgi:release factor glutamine methyltransferase